MSPACRRGLLAALSICLAAACSSGPGDGDAPAQPDLTGMEPRVAAALEEARRAVLERPGDAEAWGAFAAVCHAHRLMPEAEASYRRAIELAPEEFRWPYLLAVAREVNSADADDVIAGFEAAARLRPDYAALWVRLGDAMSIRGAYDRAATAFAGALELAPDEPLAHRGLGQVRLAQGDAEGALAPLEQAARLMPDDRVTFAALAQVYARLGRADASTAAERRAKETEPRSGLSDPVLENEVMLRGVSASRSLDRALVLLRQEELERALEDLRIVEESRPQDPVVHYWLGVALGKLKKDSTALQHYARALELDPDFVQAIIEQARTHERLGALVEADRGYRRALELRPDHGPLLATLARLLGRRERYAESAATYDRAAERTELSDRDGLLWGIAVLRGGNAQRAIGILEEALEHDPGNRDAHFNLGEAYRIRGRRADAMAQYEAAVRAGHPTAARQLERLRQP